MYPGAGAAAWGSVGADAVVDAVRSVDKSVGVWGGEIGPHNGGSPVCDHSSMRWAVFGDVLWFADALGAKAAAGYAGFCRQDYIGADYGLLDCSTGGGTAGAGGAGDLPAYSCGCRGTRRHSSRKQEKH